MKESKKVDLYWFSGTGNSLLIAKKIKELLIEKGYKVKMFPMEKSKPENINIKNTIGLVFPVAMQGTYQLVWDFAKNIRKTIDGECFVVDTLSHYSGGIIGPMKKLLKRNGYKIIGAREIKMPNNFIKKLDEEKLDSEKMKDAYFEVEKFIKNLIEGKSKTNDIPIYSDFMSYFSRSNGFQKLYRKMLPIFIDKKKCVNCKICIEICPVKNLRDNSEETPIDVNKCILCNRCKGFCPKNAIKIGNEVSYNAVTLSEIRNELCEND